MADVQRTMQTQLQGVQQAVPPKKHTHTHPPTHPSTTHTHTQSTDRPASQPFYAHPTLASSAILNLSTRNTFKNNTCGRQVACVGDQVGQLLRLQQHGPGAGGEADHLPGAVPVGSAGAGAARTPDRPALARRRTPPPSVLQLEPSVDTAEPQVPAGPSPVGFNQRESAVDTPLESLLEPEEVGGMAEDTASIGLVGP
jgi:hypothetical protein